MPILFNSLKISFQTYFCFLFLFVVFAVLITVYMEYRKQIGKCFSKHNRNNTPAIGIRRVETKHSNTTGRFASRPP